MNVLAIKGQTAAEAAFSIGVFAAALVVTGVFGYYLVAEPTRLVELWEWTRSLNILVQVIIWLLCLPWMIALWVWVSPLALPVRLVLVLAVLAVATWLLFPWKA
jgi:hypothetical protein